MGLTFIAIVLLVAAWAALLLPDLRRRGGVPRRSGNSIESFNRQLSTLDRARPGQRPGARVVAFPQRPAAVGVPRRAAASRSASLAPRNRVHARQRRQQVLFGLAAIAFLTLVAGIVISPLLLVVHVLVDIALGGYLWLLVDHRNRRYERETKRQLLGVVDVSPRPLRRTASGS